MGTGTIEIDGKEIQLPFKKAYGLVFYLAIEGLSSRDTIVNLLWGEQNEKLAKKNLRNAVYVVRKALGDDYIISPQRDLLSLNSEFVEYIDVLSIDEMDSIEILSLTEIEFLQSFNLKDSEYFDEWISNNRYHFMEKIKKRMKIIIEKDMETANYEEAETLCRKILTIDAYDESVYIMLFRTLKEQNKYKMVLNAYNELCEKLNDELMLTPDEETKRVFEEIMMIKSKENKEKQKNIYGRKSEINVLKAGLNNYIHSNSGSDYLLYGEFGVGKSTIVNSFYEEIINSYIVFMGRCYKAEMNFLLSPWFVLLEEMAEKTRILGNEENADCLETVEGILSSNKVIVEDYKNPRVLNGYVIEKTIIELMTALSKNKLVVLIFEDIKWMDSLSFKILIKLMEMNILVVLTANTDYYPIEYYIDKINISKVLNKIEIRPFSKLETFEFIHEMKKEEVMNLEILDRIYEETQGNPLYIAEILNGYENLNSEDYSGKINDVMQKRFRMLSSDEQKLLNISSNFYDYFNYEDIKSISGMDEFAILDVISQLLKKNMINEVVKGENVYFTFSHHAFRESVYSSLPISIKRVYHGKIGLYLERNAGENPSLNMLYRMIYNFSNARNLIKELTYRIKFVSYYFNFAHEKFPVIAEKSKEYTDYGDIIDLRGIHKELDKIEKLYKQIFNEINEVDEYARLQFDYCKLIGRYYNINGELDKAINLIEMMLKLSKKIGSKRDEFGALLQKIYYAINIRDIKSFYDTLDNAFELAKEMESTGHEGIILRLKGYAYILDGKFQMGIDILKDSLKIFLNIEDKKQYILNIVGAYYYMGEGYRFLGKFSDSMNSYNRAIELCKDYGYKHKLAFIFGSMGQVHYELGDYITAEKYLKKAKSLYDMVENAWGKTVALGYYGLSLMRDGKYQLTLEILKQIDDSKTIIYNPYDSALIQRIKAEVCYYLRMKGLKNQLFEYINCNEKSYCEIAIENLEKFNSTYELELLEKMNSLCCQCRTNH